MESRFSKEYVDEVTNMVHVQAEWTERGMRVGDWFYHTLGEHIDLLCGDPETDTVEFVDTRIIRWLPTLDDLVELLVKHFRHTECSDMLVCAEGAALGHLRGNVFNDYHRGSYQGGELGLLAARLLERVLEEEGDG